MQTGRKSVKILKLLITTDVSYVLGPLIIKVHTITLQLALPKKFRTSDEKYFTALEFVLKKNLNLIIIFLISFFILYIHARFIFTIYFISSFIHFCSYSTCLQL